MNYSIIGYLLRYILCAEGVLMLFPACVSLIYRENSGFVFFACAAVCILLAFPFTLTKKQRGTVQAKEGFVSVALGWLVLSIMGALPFILTGAISNPIDAFFETVSGFTTTGASILSDVEAMPKGVLFWRSFTHWIGGMGVLVFILTVLPMSGGSHMNLMKAESPGPSVDKLAPKVQTTAKILYSIYIALTLTQIVLLIISGMPVFDSVTTAFGTAGTGGFSIKNSSIAGYNTVSQIIITVFMIMFGVNFNAYYLILTKRFRRAIKNEEIIVYLSVIAVAILIISIDVRNLYSPGRAVQQSAFQVGSIITTTGFATADFNLWPQLSRTVLVMLMFIGACAGSTGGGIKVSRFIILVKTVAKELHSFQHPKSVKRIKFNGKLISHEVVRATNVFIVAYVLLFAGSILIISLDEFDLVTNFTAVAATFNNIGPGLELVGPTGNYAMFSPVSKLVLIFDMLAGRLEIFPILMLFYRYTWKKF